MSVKFTERLTKRKDFVHDAFETRSARANKKLDEQMNKIICIHSIENCHMCKDKVEI